MAWYHTRQARWTTAITGCRSAQGGRLEWTTETGVPRGIETGRLQRAAASPPPQANGNANECLRYTLPLLRRTERVNNE
eukprot:COSAG02_NODE_12550_length_1527_cov_1.086134_2_plen_79_part_00